MMFRLLLLTLWLETSNVESQFNLYDTHQIVNNKRLQYDCLYYYERQKAHSFSNLDYILSQLVQYCLRSDDGNSLSTGNNLIEHNQKLTFQQLRHMNMTAEQLLLWSASIDLAEQYQDYLYQPINSYTLSEIFFNCTEPWFGSHCQYSFNSDKYTLVDKVLQDTFNAKWKYINPDEVTDVTCYIHLQCDRGGPSICLDCLDGDLDEAHCFDLEVNECGENEFRCYNGLCISKEFWQSGDHYITCPNQPPTLAITGRIDSCFSGCEERSCPPGLKSFACGDGQCVEMGDIIY